MEIIIDRIINKKLIIDEIEGILDVYQKLLNDPKTKILKKSTSLKIKFGISIFIVIINIVILFFIQHFIIYIILGITIMNSINFYKKVEDYSNFLEIQNKHKVDSYIEISEHKIEYTDNTTYRIKLLEWANVKQILMSKNCICIMPDYKESMDMNVIFIPRDYEIKFLEILKKIGKDKLITFN